MGASDLRSVLLNISSSACVFASPDRLLSALCKSRKVSFNGRIFPCASNACTPRDFSVFAALSVGAESERMMFRSAVPPSEPFTPLSARTPSMVESSVTPPDRFFAVPPTVRNASPSCATLVLVLDDVRAIWSTIMEVCSRVRPRADCASVTISDAYARSIPPAAARLRTFGSIAIEVSASYPASAM